jgi:hypothetical protein
MVLVDNELNIFVANMHTFKFNQVLSTSQINQAVPGLKAHDIIVRLMHLTNNRLVLVLADG